MDQLNAFNTILEYNLRFRDIIIHNCPCYAVEYADFNDICINNKSYLACIIVKKNGVGKVLHLKLPIVFGSLIDYTIRGKAMTNYNQFGCLYLDGSLKVIYIFISNNLTNAHVYSNEKRMTRVFKVDTDDGTFALHLVYNPTGSESNKVTFVIQDIQYEKRQKLEQHINNLKKTIEKDKIYTTNNEDAVAAAISLNEPLSKKRKINELTSVKPQPKKSKTKTKAHKKLEKLMNEFSGLTPVLEDKSKEMHWLELLNAAGKRARGGMANAVQQHEDFKEEDHIALFEAYLQHAPKLDDISNKVNRTLSYIMHRALMHNIDICHGSDPELKNLGPKLTNTFKNGNMYYTLAQYLNTDSKLVKGFKSIYQNVEAQKLNLGAMMTSTVKRSVNDTIKNSKALLFSNDGYWFICTIDSREMKGAGENVMLGQLVIIPIGIDVEKVVQFIVDNEDDLKNGTGKVLKCVINSYLQPFTIAHSNLIKIKNAFPTLSLMVFDGFLIISTSGYNQMKYSIKYGCFMNTHEYENIWTDAFEDYHPHLSYNTGAMYLPESIEMGLPAKLTVANANIKGACMTINSVLELVMFLHTNGASNAALIHRAKRGDSQALVTFDGKRDHDALKILIPIRLKNPQMRYIEMGILGKVPEDAIPENVRILHKHFQPKEDLTEAYGLSMKDIIPNASDTMSRIYHIMYNLYDHQTRVEFVNTRDSKLVESDEPLLVTDDNENEQIIYDNHLHHIKCYTRKNEDILEEYKKLLEFDVKKQHPPQMYVPVAFGDVEGGTNEDGIVIDFKLAKFGPKKLISQTLNITYKSDLKKEVPNVSYKKIANVIGSEIVFGCLTSSVKVTFSKTKNTIIKEIFIAPSSYQYFISVKNTSDYKKYMSSTFSKKTSNINIHFSYLVPIGIGTKLSTSHGQKGVVCKIADLSSIVGYTKDGEQIHPLVLFSPTSVLGRTMASQVYSMMTQPKRAFTETGVLISPHGLNVHNIDPSIKTKVSEVKNDLMTAENGFVYNELAHAMKILSSQKTFKKKELHKMHYVSQLLALQGINLKLLSFDAMAILMGL